MWFNLILFSKHLAPIISFNTPKCPVRLTNHHHVTNEASEAQRG